MTCVVLDITRCSSSVMEMLILIKTICRGQLEFNYIVHWLTASSKLKSFVRSSPVPLSMKCCLRASSPVMVSADKPGKCMAFYSEYRGIILSGITDSRANLVNIPLPISDSKTPVAYFSYQTYLSILKQMFSCFRASILNNPQCEETRRDSSIGA